MKEEVLQEKLIEFINSNTLLTSIKNKERVDDSLKKNFDSEFLPLFSIDRLLKEKYSASAKRVLDNLDDCEIISGDAIKNISLESKERLYPDVVLFNTSKRQLIVIENKTSAKTEREAVTELFGYAHEIRNHLPFVSDYDINFILIAISFNTLLDHAVAGQLLNTDINLLCLKPEIISETIAGFNVHFPFAWSDIGQLGLPADALVGYTMCLYQREDSPLEKIDVKSVIKMAADLIQNKATKFKSSGLYLVWRNGHANFPNQCVFGISLYVINPFAFLSPAYELGFPINDKSALAQYLKSYTEEQGTLIHQSSLFAIADEAELLLSEYFKVEWDRATSWQIDMADKMFAQQRYPLQWDSWGAIGDYVRYLYLHPASKNHLFSEWDFRNGGGYLSPYIGLQIVDLLAGEQMFKLGAFSHKELFRFGMQVGFYTYACKNAMGLDEDRATSYNAFLFWNALQITRSIKDISARVRDTGDVEATVSFPLAISKSAIRSDYEDKIHEFVLWFKDEFINSEKNPTTALIFELATKTFAYFDFYFAGTITKEEKKLIESDYSYIVREKVAEIALDRRRKPDQNAEIIDFLDTKYFDGNLLNLSADDLLGQLKEVPDELLTDEFEENFLALLDMIKPRLLHSLGPIRLPKSLDWSELRRTADELYEAGQRKTSILIGLDGTIGLGTLESPMSLNNKDQIFIQFFPGSSLQQMTLRINWKDLLDDTFDFS